MPHLRFVPCMAKCYLAWPLFPCGFMFHRHKRQPVPGEPGPARLVSADPDMAGGWIPICSEVESLRKAGQTGFLDSKSVLGKSLGPCIFFTDPRAPDAGAASSSVPKWEMKAGDRVISHTCRPHTGACAHACTMVSAHGNGRARKGECLPSARG